MDRYTVHDLVDDIGTALALLMLCALGYLLMML